jgi:ribosome-associated heat shock protein Hsp15
LTIVRFTGGNGSKVPTVGTGQETAECPGAAIVPPVDADRVRLDIWLDVACLFKTRAEAQRACKLGQVVVDGTAAKPHRDVRVGSAIVISRPNGRKQIVIVRGIADRHVTKSAARELYDDRTPPPTPAEVDARRLARLHRAVSGPPRRLDRREQQRAARRKFTT